MNINAAAISLIFAVISGVLLAVLYFFIRYLRFSRLATLRASPVFNSLGEEVRRSAEEGSFIHVAVGHGSIIGEDALISVGVLEGLRGLTDLSAAYDTLPVITAGEPTLYLLVDDWMRRAYVRKGNVERYQPSQVQFTAATPAAYAAATLLNLYDRKIGSNVIMGEFGQEASLIAEAASRRGIYSAGAVASPPAIGALYPLLGQDQLAMGEELFAGAAEVSNRPVYRASLWAQDWLRLIVTAVLFGGAVISFFQ